MSSKIYAIVGLPGSGKTTLAFRWSKELNLPVIDDPKTADGNKRKEIEKLIADGQSFILCDIFLCDPVVRSRFEATMRNLDPAIRIFYHFFENKPEKCMANVLHRNDGRDVSLSLKKMAAKYTIPSIYLPMTIYNGDLNETNTTTSVNLPNPTNWLY